MTTATATKSESSNKVRLLRNTFAKGEKVVLPAGTKYTTTAPGIIGKQVTKRKSTVTVEVVFESYMNSRFTGHGTVYAVSAPRIYCAGAGGYWKEFILTEEIFLLNNKPVEYKEIRK